MTLHLMRKRRLLVPVPFAVAEIQARLFELLPNPPLTTGQIDLLKADNVASGALPGLRKLNIQPKTVGCFAQRKNSTGGGIILSYIRQHEPISTSRGVVPIGSRQMP